MKKQKQVKTFSCDGDIYDWLVKTLKEGGGSDFNLSSLINDYMGYLYFELKTILDFLDKKKVVVDRAWIINEVVREFYLFPPKVDVIYADPDMKRLFEQDVEIRVMDLLEKYKEMQGRRLETIRGKLLRRFVKDGGRVDVIDNRSPAKAETAKKKKK